MNETGNDQPISAETVPAIYPDRLHVYLIAKRELYGANTEIGHRCSNAVELLKNRRGAAGDQLVNIDKSLMQQIEEMERLCAAAIMRAAQEPAEGAPAGHLVQQDGPHGEEDRGSSDPE